MYTSDLNISPSPGTLSEVLATQEPTNEPLNEMAMQAKLLVKTDETRQHTHATMLLTSTFLTNQHPIDWFHNVLGINII